MRKLILATLLLLPLAAQADDAHCRHEQPRNLQLDLDGVKTIKFDIGASDLEVRASATPDNRIEGRACASDTDYFKKLVLRQEKTGDKLVVTAEQGSWFGLFNGHAYMELRASVPDDVLVQLVVGSGDASIEDARAASADTGSGDVRVERIRGEFTAKVGSGDIDARDIGALHLLSVGSGDVTVGNVRGATRVGSIGSGDLEIRRTGGPVEIGSVGSGDVSLTDVGGGVTVDSIGSGDIEVDGARGDLVVRSAGSGDVNHRGVTGRVDVPRED